MKFAIKDLEFGVAKATYWGDLRDDGLHWGLSVKGGANTKLGFVLEPRAYSERLFGFDSSDPQTWSSWLNKEVEWDDCYLEEIGDHNAVMYGFEHCDIYESKLRMTVQPYGHACLDWEGQCDLFVDDRYGKNLPFRIKADLVFAGIKVCLDQPVKASEALAYWVTDLDWGRIRLTESGKYLSGLVFEEKE